MNQSFAKVVWGINAFINVLVGKQLSSPILAALKVETKDSQGLAIHLPFTNDATTAHWCEQFIKIHEGSWITTHTQTY